MSELNLLLWSGWCGVLGSLAVLAITQIYWKLTIKQYTTSSSLLEQHIAIKELQDDVVTLRLQVIALQAHINE